MIIGKGASNTITFIVQSPVTSNAFSYQALAYDRGTTTAFTFNTAKSTITVNPQLSTPRIAVSSNSVVRGNSIILSSIETGGTTPYTYNFLVFNSVTNKVIATKVMSSNSASFSTNSLWASNSPLRSNVIITDSASTPIKANSIKSNTITVH